MFWSRVSSVSGQTLLSLLVQVTSSPPQITVSPAFDQITVAEADTVESDSVARSADDVVASSRTIAHCAVWLATIEDEMDSRRS